ncbi:MAG: enoyl-CoA hydratase-related protein [Flavobacteriales bacterium]|nr:enoyl-CoA hydratase-related protein [Flavobacteriales bacterium]
MENIKQELIDHTLVLTINREKQLNALNKTTILELSQALDAAAENSEVKAIVITGAGEKAFVAGADIKEFAHFSVEEGASLSAQGQDLLFNKVEQMNKPVIAAVRGYALGGGLELAMSAHVRVASTDAKLGLPEVGLGVIPGYGGTQRLAQLVGKGKAMEMIVTADMIDAQDAYQWGLVNHVVEAEQVLEKAMAIAKRTQRNSPIAINAAMKAVLANYTDGVNGYEAEIAAFGECFGTEDFKEGTSAFMEKRKAQFPGK